MKTADYYSYQTEARGFLKPEDVRRVLHYLAPVYKDIVLPWLPKNGNADLYEVACGPGIFLSWLREQGFEKARGSDNSEAQIRLAKQLGVPVEHADSVEELRRMRENSLDAVIAIDFIEHLPKNVLMEFFAETHRVLRPGGSLVLRAPNGDSPFVGKNLFNDITHVWAYTTIATRALLQMAEFTQIQFADESLSLIEGARWIKKPMVKWAQALVRRAIRFVAKEDVYFFSASIWVRALKNG